MKPSAILASISLLSLVACATHAPLKTVEAQAPINIAAGAKVSPIRISPVAVGLTFNEEWGATGTGPLCHVPSVNIRHWRPETEPGFSRGFTAVLLSELKKANYSATLDARAARSESREPVATVTTSGENKDQILVTGTVQKITLNVCYPNRVGGFSGFAELGSHESNGAAYIRTDWQIQLPSDIGSVHRMSTEGTSKIEEKRLGNDRRLLLHAFAVAVRNLLADRKFHGLIVGSQ